MDREGSWGMDSSIRNWGTGTKNEEEMAKSQGYMMTVFNTGGFGCCLFVCFRAYILSQ